MRLVLWSIASYAGMGASEKITLEQIMKVPLHDNDAGTRPIQNMAEAINAYNKLVNG